MQKAWGSWPAHLPPGTEFCPAQKFQAGRECYGGDQSHREMETQGAEIATVPGPCGRVSMAPAEATKGCAQLTLMVEAQCAPHSSSEGGGVPAASEAVSTALKETGKSTKLPTKM